MPAVEVLVDISFSMGKRASAQCFFVLVEICIMCNKRRKDVVSIYIYNII